LVGRREHLPNGVVAPTDADGRDGRTAVEVELTRKTEARVAGILRQLLKTYDDVVHRAARPARRRWCTGRPPGCPTGERGRVHVRPYPPPTLAAVA
jgi:hypothetical protein